MSASEDFAPTPPRPVSWQDVFEITKELRSVPIDQIERGRIDWEYTLSSKDQRACGRLGCEQKHAHGWIVALPGRRFVNIGNDCARRYANAGLWNANVGAYKQRVQELSRKAAVEEARKIADDKQQWLRGAPEISAAIALFQSFTSQAAGPFLSELEKRAERGLALVERERRLSAEEMEARRAMAMAGRFEGEPEPYIANIEKVQVGTIQGLECFHPRGNLRGVYSRLQRLVDTLLTWQPSDTDRDAERSLRVATRELAPMSNQLNASLKAVDQFFTVANLKLLMSLDVTKRQGIISIEVSDSSGVVIKRRPHWNRAA